MTPSNEKVQEIRRIIDAKVRGKIVANHDVFGHSYILPSGRSVKSVTTKLIVEKPHLRLWAVKKGIEWMDTDNRWSKLATADEQYRRELIRGAQLAHTEERDVAGNIGTEAHNIIERYLKDWIRTGARPEDVRAYALDGTSAPAIASARSAEALFTKHNVIPVETEILVGTEKWGGMAGTMDLLAFFDGELYVSDWKTSNQVSDDYAMQVSAYMHLFNDMTGLKIKKCNLVKLSKDYDKLELYNIPDPRGAFAAYKAIAKVYDWVQNGKDKLVRNKKTITI